MAVTAHLKESARLLTLGSVIKINVVWAMQIAASTIKKDANMGFNVGSTTVHNITTSVSTRASQLSQTDARRVARRMTTVKWVITARTEKFAPFTKSHTATTTCAAWGMATAIPRMQ